MWQTIAALLAVLTAPVLAQGVADLAPYVAAVGAAGAYPPGAAQKSVHLANYDEASHRALAREAFTASILGGKVAPTAKLGAGGSLIPTGARWSEHHYLFARDQRCAVFINVREVAAAMAAAVPHYAEFSVWHELAHCTLLELQHGGVAGDKPQRARAAADGFAGALPDGRGRLAYSLLSESFADSFALLVQAAVRGNDAARQLATALLDYRRLEKVSNAGGDGGGAHDTSIALGLARDALASYDLSALSARDRYVLAMNCAVDGVARWAEAEVGAVAASGLRAQLGAFENAMLARASAATGDAANSEIPVFLAYPGEGGQDSLRIR